MMGHISDRTLDNLLDGSIDDAGELAIEEHVRRCDRCAQRLREWELLFPQVKSLIPTGEHPIPSGQHPATPGPPAFATPRAPAVFVPDWTPPRTPHALPTRLAWGLVLVLALGAGYLLLQRARGEAPVIAYQPGAYQMASQSATGDSQGLGSGIAVPDSATPSTAGILTADSILARARAQAVREANLPERPEPAREPPPPPVTSRESAERDVRVPARDRETPVSFPIKVDPSTRPAKQPSPSPQEATAPPLSAQFQRVSLGEAINLLAGTVRLIQGLNPVAVEVAQGSALPGADPGKAVVRVVYNAPEGRLIMDQQRLGRGGSLEPSIAISTAPNGVSVAQWIDRGGFWISLAGRADQQTLLAIANRIR